MAATPKRQPGDPPPPDAPSYATQFRDLLECDGEPTRYGGLAEDWGADGFGATRAEALQSFLDATFFTLPKGGYAEQDSTGEWAVFTHDVEDRARVVLVFSTIHAEFYGGGWVIWAMASCDPAEFDLSRALTSDQIIWRDADGEPVPTSQVSARPGPGHCNWESATFLRLGEDTYIGDPRDVFEDRDFAVSYQRDADLPSDAVSTGFTDGRRTIWRVPGDRRAVYLVSDSHTERWPRDIRGIGCA